MKLGRNDKKLRTGTAWYGEDCSLPWGQAVSDLRSSALIKSSAALHSVGLVKMSVSVLQGKD